MSIVNRFEGVAMPAPSGFRAFVVRSKTGMVVFSSGQVFTDRDLCRHAASEASLLFAEGTDLPAIEAAMRFLANERN